MGDRACPGQSQIENEAGFRLSTARQAERPALLLKVYAGKKTVASVAFAGDPFFEHILRQAMQKPREK